LLTALQGLTLGGLAIFYHRRPDVSEHHEIGLGLANKFFIVPLNPQCPETGSFKKNPDSIQLHKVRRQFLREDHS
jgi:hypothetical protein